MTEAVTPLPDDISPSFDAVETVNGDGTGPLLFVCEHASNFIPSEYGTLGLDDDALSSHIAWDPGARELALKLCGFFNAPLVASRVSRLVYDCNRPPESIAAMPERSEVYDIPGNKRLSVSERLKRTETVYRPFQDAVQTMIEQRTRRGWPTALVTIHSFTPVYNSARRDVEIGIIHDTDTRLADAMLEAASGVAPRRVERNSPYSAADGVAHTLQVFGTADGRPNVMIEVRNDLLKDVAGISALSAEIAVMLIAGLRALGFEDEAVGHA